MKITINEILSACDGTLICGNKNAIIKNVSLCSQNIEGNTLFIPVKDDKDDTHKYVEDAFKHGAIASLTQNYSDFKNMM